MKYFGEWRKMRVELDEENTVHYQFVFFNSVNKTEQLIPVNQFIGKQVSIHFTQNIYCKKCGTKTSKSFQGFCYPCFKDAPEAAECIIHPERCQAHLGKGRDVAWEKKFHDRPHIVYLAANDAIKVGVTSVGQIPIRWIDQGAFKAIILAETPNRYIAGVIEVALKEQFTDKTNWRTMLRNDIDESIDLEDKKWELEELLPEDIAQYISEDDTVTFIHYPVQAYPTKVKSVNLEKSPFLSGKLMGIKGQYLLFDEGRVINIRRHEGYEVEFQNE